MVQKNMVGVGVCVRSNEPIPKQLTKITTFKFAKLQFYGARSWNFEKLNQLTGEAAGDRQFKHVTGSFNVVPSFYRGPRTHDID
jgi:hypothetical protein